MKISKSEEEQIAFALRQPISKAAPSLVERAMGFAELEPEAVHIVR